MKRITYRSSGVNIDKGNEAVRRIKKHVKKTFNRHVLADIGLFGGLFELDTKRYRKPVLVSSTDVASSASQS